VARAAIPPRSKAWFNAGHEGGPSRPLREENAMFGANLVLMAASKGVSPTPVEAHQIYEKID
ncbi:MAG TPA: hypothetical protein VHN73_05460, partial [Phenylobacterium sp.]|nr:hypothetical protein [Phenylobacterium sp.]